MVKADEEGPRLVFPWPPETTPDMKGVFRSIPPPRCQIKLFSSLSFFVCSSLPWSRIYLRRGACSGQKRGEGEETRGDSRVNHAFGTKRRGNFPLFPLFLFLKRRNERLGGRGISGRKGKQIGKADKANGAPQSSPSAKRGGSRRSRFRSKGGETALA